MEDKFYVLASCMAALLSRMHRSFTPHFPGFHTGEVAPDFCQPFLFVAPLEVSDAMLDPQRRSASLPAILAAESARQDGNCLTVVMLR